MKKKTMQRIKVSDRIVAFLLTLTMLFTFMPHYIANADEEQKGIGITNTILTAQENSDTMQTTYKITLYKCVEVPSSTPGGRTDLYLC